MSQDSVKQPIDDEILSFCDILKNDTSEIIKKIESTSPPVFQNYSDLYYEYLHLFDDMYSTCYLAEKEFFDNLNIDQNLLRQIKKNSELYKKMTIQNIDFLSTFLNNSSHTRMSGAKVLDNYFHNFMENYTKMLSQYNKFLKNNKND